MTERNTKKTEGINIPFNEMEPKEKDAILGLAEEFNTTPSGALREILKNASKDSIKILLSIEKKGSPEPSTENDPTPDPKKAA